MCCQINEDLSQELLVYQNKGTSLSPNFEIKSGSEMGLDPLLSNSFLVPEIIDLDKDGDLDLFLSGHTKDFSGTTLNSKPIFLFAKNNGTPNAPKYFGWYSNVYNLIPLGSENMYLEGGDIDLDGDVDFLGGILAPNSSYTYFENQPLQNGKSHFIEPSFTILGLPYTLEDDNLFFPSLVDIDNDKDLDLFVTRDFEEQIQLEYYKNNQLSGTNAFEVNNSIIISPNPTQGAVSLTIDPDVVIKQIALYNSVGTLLKSYDNNATEINFSAFDPGIYFMALTTKYSSIRVKIVYIR